MRFKEDELSLAIGTIFHNKAAEMKRMLYSVSQDGVDQWFLIGGAFANAPEEAQQPDEATLDVLETFKTEQRESGSKGIKVITEWMNGANEFQKRMKYVDLCRQCDANSLFIVDTDEYVYENEEWGFKTSWEQFRRDVYGNMIKYPDHNVFAVSIIQNEYLQHDNYPRLWNFPEQMTYIKGSHYKFANPEMDKYEDALFNHQYVGGGIRGVTLKHDHTLRSDEDMGHRRKYQDWLVQYEYILDADYNNRKIEEINLEAIKRTVPFRDNCMCFKCVKIKNMDPTHFFDPRPRDKRQKDPYITGIPL
jgi:hypothetical protein